MLLEGWLDSPALTPVALGRKPKYAIFPNFGATVPVLESRSWFKTFQNLCVCRSSVAQSGLTLCDPVDCSPPGSPVHGISQAGILEWVAIFFSRGSSQPKDQSRI